MKLTLPNIQKMELGGEDSIRIISKKRKYTKKDTLFEELVKGNRDTLNKGKKRIKQGDEVFLWMNIQGVQGQKVSLRRKDANLNPWMDKNLFNLSLEKSEEKLVDASSKFRKKEKISDVKEKLDTENYRENYRRDFIDNLTAIQTRKTKSSNVNSKVLNSSNNNEYEDYSITNFNFKNPSDDEIFSQKVKETKDDIFEEKFIQKRDVLARKLNKNENENIDDKNALEFNKIKPLIFDNNYDFDSRLNSIFIKNNINESKIANPIFRHLASNISQTYNYSLDQILNCFDSISFKAIDSGFAVKMKLFPEELGELELHLKKEGQDISLIALVLNEEAKQVMMKDIENLSNFFNNQGYNLQQVMVEVNNENQNKNFENFDKLIAENRNISKTTDFSSSVNQTNTKYQLQKLFYSKGIGRIINKYI